LRKITYVKWKEKWSKIKRVHTRMKKLITKKW